MKKLFFLFLTSFLFSSTFNEFYKKFIVNNSYTIDPYHSNRVTSEAQGYSLYLCVKYNKKELFDSIWQWTKTHLQRKDYLFAWEYKDKIIDNNNASDADFFIAYSLLLAYEKWGEKNYLEEFKKILKSLNYLFLPVLWEKKLDILLFPAKYGFLKDNVLTIFPSYYIPFIFKKFSKFNILYEKAYRYSYTIFLTNNLTTHIYYHLIKKEFFRGNYMDLDVYRIIWYSYLDKKNVKDLKDTFKDVDLFFQKHGFIPLKLYINGKYEQYSPYCVYKWFYLVYNDKEYLNMYKKLKKRDKNNYFCEALDLMKGEE